MTKIRKYALLIDEELASAKDYAERYLEYKAKYDTQNAQIFKQMAQDELEHSKNLHQVAVNEIEELKRVYTPSPEMEEKWNKAHTNYVDKSAWIKQMLAM